MSFEEHSAGCVGYLFSVTGRRRLQCLYMVDPDMCDVVGFLPEIGYQF